MRIAFVSANREVLPDPVVPLGLAYLMGNTPARHERQLIDLCWSDEPLATLAGAMEAFRPDVVALGLRNLQNSDYGGTRDNLAYYQEVVTTIRRVTRVPLIVGGGGFSVLAAGLMQRLRPDYGVLGEAEHAFVQLLDRLENGAGASGVKDIAGLYWFNDGTLVENPSRPEFQDLNALVWPDRSQIDARYYAQSGIEAVQTKRGCALRCTYCTYPTIEGRGIRQREPAQVVDEMVAAKELHPGVSHFFIVDSNFNLPRAHAKAVCRELIARSWQIPWTCYANPLGFDDELARLMVRAGCAGVEIGSDSGCDEILDRLCKGFDTHRIRATRRLAAAAGLRDCHTFVLGTSGETLAEVRRTLDFVHELQPFAAILMIWSDDEEVIDAELAAKRRAFRAEVQQLVEREARTHRRWIVPTSGISFNPRLFAWLRRRGLRGPLWQHLGGLDGGGSQGAAPV